MIFKEKKQAKLRHIIICVLVIVASIILMVFYFEELNIYLSILVAVTAIMMFISRQDIEINEENIVVHGLFSIKIYINNINSIDIFKGVIIIDNKKGRDIKIARGRYENEKILINKLEELKREYSI